MQDQGIYYKLTHFLSLLLFLPLAFITVSASSYDFPEFFSHPAIILGSLVVPLILNFTAIFRFSITHSEGTAVNIKIKLKFWNVLSLALSLLMLGIIFIYLFFENFAPAYPGF